jgi:broad specificity phosphatase PhoE
MSTARERFLLLIRHAAPQIVPGAPARDWRLSDDGRRGCELLAGRVAPYAPSLIVSSVEPKARETADLLGAQLGVPVETAPGLHEHERDNVGYLGREQFEAALAAFFARPDELVLGRETAAQALARFSRAMDELLAAHPTGTLAVVTHGTVLSLFVAARVGIESLPFWRGLALPDLVVLSLPGFDLFADGCTSTPI